MESQELETDRKAGGGSPNGGEPQANGTDPIPELRVASNRIGSFEAYRTWQESVDDVFSTRPLSTEYADSFLLDMHVWHLGPLVLGRFRSGAQCFERVGRTIALGGLDHFLFQLYTRGGYSGLAGGSDIRVRAGDIGILDLTRTLETRTGDFENITLIVPRGMVEALTDDADLLAGRVLQGEKPLTRMLANQMRLLMQAVPTMSTGDADTAARATMALIVAAAGGRSSRLAGDGQMLASPFRAIIRHIDENIHDPDLSPQAISDALGMSRAALYRLFKPAGGIAEYIRIRRLSGALANLKNDRMAHRSVGEIGYAWGFSSPSVFTRAFRAHFGVSPSEARTQNCRVPAEIRGSVAGLSRAKLAYWMRTLSAG